MKKTTEFKQRTGEFYTPKIWVDEAHKFIEENFIPTWKEDYVIWDPAAGQGALTKDYTFLSLYNSTLLEEDAELLKGQNPNSFQFDFLNDDLDKAFQFAPDLKHALENDKPIAFLMNPPYAGSGNAKTDGSSKKGVAITQIKTDMANNKLGKSSNNLYAQFYYRIMKIKKTYNLSNVMIFSFTPPSFITSQSYKNFRIQFFNEFKIINSFLFQASEFEGLSPLWGIGFFVMTSNTEINNNFTAEIKVRITE